MLAAVRKVPRGLSCLILVPVFQTVCLNHTTGLGRSAFSKVIVVPPCHLLQFRSDTCTPQVLTTDREENEGQLC